MGSLFFNRDNPRIEGRRRGTIHKGEGELQWIVEYYLNYLWCSHLVVVMPNSLWAMLMSSNSVVHIKLRIPSLFFSVASLVVIAIINSIILLELISNSNLTVDNAINIYI